jgi:hypothetical protein
MTREAEDYIRDEIEVSEMLGDGDSDWLPEYEEDAPICECDYCGDTLYEGDEMTGFIFAGINKINTLRLCKYCMRNYGSPENIGEIIDSLDGESKTGDAEEVFDWMEEREAELTDHRERMLRPNIQKEGS